jgi:hypothetical protein
MKALVKFGFLVGLALVGLSFPSRHVFAEDWKTYYDRSEMTLGGLAGLAIIDSSAGFTVLGTISKKILAKGFVPDISNSVSIEAMIGPAFVSGTTAVMYSGQLRWDFEKDDVWTLYAIGGAGGNYLSVGGNSRVEFMPRFGVGAFWCWSEFVRFRGEIAHDLIGVGVNFAFF